MKITEVRFLAVGKKGKKYGKGKNEHKSGSFEVKLEWSWYHPFSGIIIIKVLFCIITPCKVEC